MFALFTVVLYSQFLALAWHVVGTKLKLTEREKDGKGRKENTLKIRNFLF